MKKFSPIQLQLIKRLADGACYSGSVLGEQLGVSRTAIWKHIRQLIDLGLPIQRLPQQGYQLTVPIQLLNEETIQQQLKIRGFKKPLHFHLFPTIDSTNQFLKNLPSSSLLEICCSEMQTHGRGRFGRHWVSPFGENIYCSTRWELNCDLSQLSGLSLVVGIAILSSLKDSGIHEEILLKWPNDLLWKDKKLCGILIEITAETHANSQVIIGIGLNVNTATNFHPLPEKPWCSLYEITGQYHDRNRLLANLIYQLHRYVDKFLHTGFASFTDEWRKVDYLFGKSITVLQPTGSIQGSACGVNKLGQLCLVDEQGTIHYLSFGDTSLSEIER
ncbi:biotin--[acetyl-CoA-carboxylase] ligase [Legionella hackeliae]|uniref:Bifunctional ligase/repressor BirA n=1 Tax=Legionella hackeliae TaxID=449 RepID=A0A0A8UNE1_LEGHA|nr:biotin--[acetyl-CoA-carboxylase] ligase [Legionella hackeliae]KTD08835.1 biotin-[acetylCoA carboxylase] holoenzyme synthetase and biotin operon repressor [Legionella hackeliae]CEK10263.1 Biotin synthetase [Legionella hackeliae]STX46992.1 biotin-[acetylCoA carboxylase] holoenzyme synthetase and biotin operon repressor [Legionella hackeliae]